MRATLLFLLLLAPSALAAPTVERWGLFEIELAGPKEGNPFVDANLSAEFSCGDRKVKVDGFYDGDGRYRIRFMPEEVGEWKYQTASNKAELNGKSGIFTATAPSAGNRGPVRVRNRHHFAYADGAPHFSFGTTCYAWTHQPADMQERTLATLKTGPFNKLRMCVMPKWYDYNRGEPTLFPFAGTPPRTWDFARFNPAFFAHLDKRIGQLRDLGIEADLILFHPYDKGHWGFDRMPADADDRYLRYMVARYAAYRNVWWSLANEFDFMEKKTEADWLRFLKIVADADPYAHLRSVHNGSRLFDNANPLVTHASIQNGSAVEDFGRPVLYRDAFRKPVVYDEVKYEGNLPQRWGNLTGLEMAHRFWIGTISGTYVGHGETFRDANDEIWWAKGGKWRGESPDRIGFLRRIVEAGPATGLDLIDKWQDHRTAGKAGEYYLVYLGKEPVKEWSVELPRAGFNKPLTLKAEIIDAWNMKITPVEGAFTLKPTDFKYLLRADPPRKIALPGVPMQAIRLTPSPMGRSD